MPLSVYLDDCSDENLLIARLRQAGYDVISPREAGTVGIDDLDHLEYASRHGHAILTHNPQDFVELHHLWQTQGRRHNGVILIYRDNDPAKDMTAGETVCALENLLASGLSVANSVHTVNHWRTLAFLVTKAPIQQHFFETVYLHYPLAILPSGRGHHPVIVWTPFVV